EFVRVRLTRINGVNLNLFEFDYDLTWAAFFVSADERIYGRFGGRDASGPDSRNSLAGLKYAMEAALKAHRAGAKPPLSDEKPLRVEDYPAARRARGCIHCHQIWESRRSYLKSSGKWNRDEVWVYPLPENIGLKLELDRGDRIQSVKPESA